MEQGVDSGLLGRYVTTAVLMVTMVGVGAVIASALGWRLPPQHAGRAFGLLVMSYIIAASLLLGLNAFVREAHREYQQLKRGVE